MIWLAATAFASSGAEGSARAGGHLPTVVTLIVGIGLAYVLAHFVVERLQRRFLMVTGLEYIVLGIGLGPVGLGAFTDLTALAPIIALAAGWVGLVYGLELGLRQSLASQDGAMRLAVLDALGTGALVAICAHWFFSRGLFGPVDPRDAWLAAGAMGCASAAGSSTAIDLISRRYGRTEGSIDLLRRAASLGDMLAIGAFGLLFCIFHEGAPAAAPNISPSDWTLITLGLGLALGVLFSVFLGPDESENAQFLALVGIIAFASGAAFFLNLSLLAVNLILGFMLAWVERQASRLAATLRRTSRPMSLVLLVFAGALWIPPSLVEVPAVLVASAGYIVVRGVGKLVGCWMASLGTGMRADLSRGLLAQGDVAIAMAISFRLVYHGPAVDLAYTAILASVVVHEFLAPRVLKGLLVDAGEVRAEATPAQG